MEIKAVDTRYKKVWDEIVDNSQNGTICHKWEWLGIMCKHSKAKQAGKSSGCRLYPLMGFVDDEAVAILPVFYYKTAFGLAFSPPVGVGITRLGPVLKNYGNQRQRKKERILEDFIKSANRFICTELKPSAINIKTSPGFDDPRPFIWSGYEVGPLFDYIFDLTLGEENLFSGIDKKTRQNINRGGRSGLKFSEGGKKDIEFIWETATNRYAEQDIDFSVTLEYLQDLYEKFPQNLKVFTVKEDGRIVNGSLDICYKDRVSLWIGNTKIENTNPTANDFLNWEIIRWACRNGYRSCENIWANDERLCAYKSKFNPVLSPYFSVEKNSFFYSLMKKLKYGLHR